MVMCNTLAVLCLNFSIHSFIYLFIYQITKMKMIDGYLKIETKAGWVKHI